MKELHFNIQFYCLKKMLSCCHYITVEINDRVGKFILLVIELQFDLFLFQIYIKLPTRLHVDSHIVSNTAPREEGNTIFELKKKRMMFWQNVWLSSPMCSQLTFNFAIMLGVYLELLQT